MVVESDKADMDVESFEEGYLAAVLTEEGSSAKVGAAVALIVERWVVLILAVALVAFILVLVPVLVVVRDVTARGCGGDSDGGVVVVGG